MSTYVGHALTGISYKYIASAANSSFLNEDSSSAENCRQMLEPCACLEIADCAVPVMRKATATHCTSSYIPTLQIGRGAESQKQKKGTQCSKSFVLDFERKKLLDNSQELREAINCEKKRCFVKSLNKMSPFYEVPIYFFRPFFMFVHVSSVRSSSLYSIERHF